MPRLGILRKPGKEEKKSEAKSNPGKTAYKIAKIVGVDYRVVHSGMATLEKLGYLISEDECGRLYVFEDSHD